MINFFSKILGSLLLAVGIHHSTPVVQQTPQPAPVVTTQSSPVIEPVAAPAVTATPVATTTPVTTPQKPTEKKVTVTTATAIKASTPVAQVTAPATAIVTAPALTPEQVANNAIEAGEAAYAEQQREQQDAARAAAIAAANQQAADAAAQATQQQALVNSKQYKLDAINQQIAALNAKYAADKIALQNSDNTGGGVGPGASTAGLSNLYTTYMDNYNLLEAQYQVIETSN